MVRVVFVCLGNICRSPTAEGVFKRLLRDQGLQEQFEVDSAGTSAYHVGERADARSRQAARRRGIELDGRSRQFVQHDFERFDHVVAMDTDNLKELSRSRPKNGRCGKLSLLLDFDPKQPEGSSVPDPYYGGAGGFDGVLDLCQSACEMMLQQLVREHGMTCKQS